MERHKYVHRHMCGLDCMRVFDFLRADLLEPSYSIIGEQRWILK